jgi:hypothetical protein
MVRTITLCCILTAAAVAADVSGTWNVTAVSSEGREYKLELTLKQEDGKWTGTMSSERGAVPLQKVQVAGDSVNYVLAVGEASYEIKLTAADGVLKGTYTRADGVSGQVKAVRPPAAAPGSIDGKWKLTATTASRPEGMNLALHLAKEGEKWTGSIGPEEGGSAAISDAVLTGTDLTFKVVADQGTYELKLTFTGDSVKGSYKGPEGRTGTLTGKRY